MTELLVHLVYIHGFQGDETSFQSFPKDLQEYLSATVVSPTNPTIKFQSSLYPTYKSRKPIAEATHNFLAWLKTQPPGPVILMAHSMGGLLAADAATGSFNAGPAKSRRILGVIAFDVPYLGMHPHVVVSGLASLFPKELEETKEKHPKEADVNKHADVQIVDRAVTEDWETFKSRIDGERSHSQPLTSPPTSLDPPLPSPPPRSKSPILDKTLSFLSHHANGKVGNWLQKHSNDPFSAGKRIVVEYFQFGSSMFDPSGLKDRYTRLVAWQDGLWVNYWTQVPKPVVHEEDPALGHVETVDSVPSTASTPPIANSSLVERPDSPPRKTDKKKEKKQKKNKSHHFIVLPNGLGEYFGGLDRWEKVMIGGVADEVAAHTGLFIRGSNLEYEQLVQRVADRVIGWCAVLK
ncbi:hypothetical protein MIND_00910000 [Mycena indigotica]|uniref:AB hydrolase-1 domain-containing protein n=1 Tax=Mycena indigotica TaxID=2126181 RepID=A0A8H6SDK3_9AGAR|nr:uncharacterized protein MIND_00910000 [Mycena indigotica]KAF7296790.1 hypothetical protein MIND_00910000 [Mycena indigotica]